MAGRYERRRKGAALSGGAEIIDAKEPAAVRGSGVAATIATILSESSECPLAWPGD